jgi:hypothetical protein
MAEDFYLDEDGVVHFAKGLKRTGNRLTDSYEELTNTLTGYVGCWGDDEIGKGFEKNYWDNSQELIEGMKGGGEGLVDSANGAKKSAHYFADLDLHTAKWLDSQKPDDDDD